jgi:Mg2+ and Co2+ transporter CorA
LSKLVELHSDSESESSDSEEDDAKKSARKQRNKHRKKRKRKSVLSRLLFLLGFDPPEHKEKRNRTEYSTNGNLVFNSSNKIKSHGTKYFTQDKKAVRTLQRYKGGPNVERTEYFEQHSTLSDKNLAVSVEQVSIFMTADNTVISFFEHSANDIEEPILRRLENTDTILRKSSDASMMVQAIIDAIIDLAIPVTQAYEDAISELEIDVLTDPSIERSKALCTYQSCSCHL